MSAMVRCCFSAGEEGARGMDGLAGWPASAGAGAWSARVEAWKKRVEVRRSGYRRGLTMRGRIGRAVTADLLDCEPGDERAGGHGEQWW